MSIDLKYEPSYFLFFNGLATAAPFAMSVLFYSFFFVYVEWRSEVSLIPPFHTPFQTVALTVRLIYRWRSEDVTLSIPTNYLNPSVYIYICISVVEE